MPHAKLLFLDFDGVLHPTSSTAESPFCLTHLLDQALGDADCSIVISSSWRFQDPLSKLKRNLLPGIRRRVVGVTGAAHIGAYARQVEIERYLAAHGPADWRALDDCAWEFRDTAQLIRCDPNQGFGSVQAAALAAWLRA